MKRPALLIAAILLAAPAARAASFDCAKASTDIERMICADADLSVLDEHLHSKYEEMLFLSGDRERLGREQQRWLRDIRGGCISVGCLKVIYRHRINGIKPLGWPDNDWVRAACETLGEASAKGWLPDRLEAKKVGEPGRRTERPAAEEVSLLATERLVRVDGEPVIVTGGFGCIPELRGAEWLAPDGKRFGMCRFQKSGEDQLKLLKSDDQELCSAVLERKFETFSWSVGVTADGADLHRLDIKGGAATDAVVADIDLDGEIDTVARFQRFSGMECSDGHIWLAVIDRETGRIPDTPVNRYLTGKEWGPIMGFGLYRDSTRVILYRGKPYILGRADTRGGVVASVWEGKPRIWCKFVVSRQHKVSSVSHVDGWMEAYK